MRKLMHRLKNIVTVIIALVAVISAGCNTVNNKAVNSSNNAKNTADTTGTNDAASTADISINSISGSMAISLGKLYLLSVYSASDNNYRGTIWVDGNKLIDGEITRICADNGNVYFSDSNGVNRFNGETTLQVPGNNACYAVMNEKIYYLNKDSKTFCYNMNDKTNTFINDEPMMYTVNSDYIIGYNTHDILIMDNKSYQIIKRLHYDKMIFGLSSLDKANLYFVQYTYGGNEKDRFELTKYSIKQDNQITVLDSDERVGDIFAIDDKIVFLYGVDNLSIKYIDMRNMEEKLFTVENDIYDMNDDIIDILFDGQRIIYKRRDQTFYSISIFTGETKKIELN